ASLQSANDDGGGLAALVTDVAQPRGMAVDSVNQFAYWTEPGSLAIRRVSLDGSDVEETVAEVRNGAAGIAVDLTTGKVYWTDSDNSEINAAIRGGKIRRANLDGSQPEDVVATDLLHPGGIAVDSIENKVYWSDVEGHLDGSGRILRANLDGSNVETLLTGIDEATGLALDQRARTLYWAESATGRIQRANLDGSGLETILEVPATTVALNVETDTLYWTEGSGNVKRARLDGSDPFTIAAGVGEPWGIGVLPPLYFSWDLNSDGDFADAFGESPFLTWEQLAGFGIDDDGEYEIALRVEDGDGQTEEASATVLVANSVPSLVSITLSPDTICEGDGFTGAPAYNAFETVFPEAEGTFPFAIDNSGQIAGTVSIPNLHQGGFLRLIDGTLQPIEFPGRTYTQPLGMNNLSEIVGDTADESGHFKRGFIRRANGSFEEFDIPNVAGFQVNDINDLGQVVGVVSTLANTSQVFVREPQGQLKFFVIPAIGQHNAFGINNSGIVSGTDGYVSFLLNTADGSSTVFAYPGATQTQFSGINNRGQVAGMWFTEGAGVHGFILNPDGTYFGIDFPGARHTELRAVNDRGQVTGYYSPFQGSPRSGFIGTPDYDASKVVQLTGTVIDNGLNDTHELLVDWGDGNQSTAVVDPEARTFSGSHVYLDDDPSGTPSDQYMISVTVSDDDGGVASDSATVIVENDAPSGLVLDALTPIDLGDLATLNGAFTDPGVLDTHSILIDWGDGHTTTIQTQVGTRTFEATHPYLESNPGNEFTISVMVTDDDSGSVFASTTLVILDRPPAIEDLTISPAVADEGELVTVSGAIADPDLLDTHTVSVDWGDGSATVAVVDPQLRTFAATHAYLDDDPGGTSADQYPIAIRVTDDDGNFAETATSITVANVAPTLSIGDVPNKINVGVPFTVTAQATDPSPLDTFTFLWQVTRGGQSVAVAAGASFAFTPLDAGDYVFTLVGTDDDLGAAVTQLTLTVGPCLVPGDTNGDCAVGVVDLNNVRNHFGETGLGVVDLSFNAPSPGTLLDKDGVGVGFTHRLPGTGDGLSNTDANMDLEPGINGRLLLKSTNANANGGVNLEALEAPGVLQEGIGQDDFNLTATFLNVQLPNSGDHLTLYAGTAWNNTVRVGFHESNVYHIAINRGFGDEILYSTAVNAFAPGDDVTLTLSRRMGNWSVSWQNHTNPAASGESTAFELAFLNVEFDLYLGVQHTSPTTTVQQTATIDSFTLDILRPIPGDSNGDFIVNLIDLNAVRNNFGTSFPAPQASRSADDVTVGKPKSLARPGASNLVDAVFAQFASNGALNDLASAWPALKRRRA
ncbi:MAG: hypothetical protein SGJ19_09405, partial [Planctomycetia bacterium]|nr:hypothetical protein [Planctomycetia bacterium]